MNAAFSPSSPVTVTQLTEQIKSVLEDSFRHVWLEGELSHLNPHRSGHVYLSLKDEGARIDGVVWRSTVARLQYRPDPGEKVIVRGKLNVYAPQGGYKLIIDSIEPVGLGALQAAFNALKAQLQSEGLFEAGRKRKLPLLPRGVGVITSSTGAARRDIESVIHRRCPNIPIILYPANVQGKQAAPDIVAGLRLLNEHPEVSVIIVGRGGGSIEDLWAFNEEIVARELSRSRKPTISAVGHETDTTIADFVADVRAPTPSAAAELAVPVRDDLLYTIDLYCQRIERALSSQLQRCSEKLSQLQLRIERSLSTDALHSPLTNRCHALHSAFLALLGRERSRLISLEQTLQGLSPVLRIGRAKSRLAAIQTHLERLGDSYLSQTRHRLSEATARLDALSPLASLQRGHSITRKDGEVLTGIENLRVDDQVTVLLARGQFEASITTLSEHHMSHENKHGKTE